MKTKDLTYETAVEEIENIIKDIEYGELSVEEVNEKIKRATYLLEFCKKKLGKTKKDLNKLLDNVDVDMDL